MNEEREFTKKRLLELAKKSFESGMFTFTDFLGLDELSIFSEIKRDISHVKWIAFGGTEGAERVIIRFGDENELGWHEDFPIRILRCAPKSEKWADKLTHRDLLGAILNLGIERSLIGDIVLRDNVAYVFAHERIVTFIGENLLRAKHTDLTVNEVEKLPEGALYTTENRTVQCNSPRVDAITARVFCLSREDSQALFAKGLVFIDGRQTYSPSKELKVGETVSVRGKGRFIFQGTKSLSKKGKLNLSVEVFT